MEIEVQGRRKRGTSKSKWLDRMTGDIKKKGLSGRECTTELHGGVYRRTSTARKSGT